MALLGLACACGRVGFDSLEIDQDGTGPDSAPADRSPDAEVGALPYCTEVPGLGAAPTIDGVLEPGLLLETSPQLGWITPDRPIPSGHDARFAIAALADGLYVFAEVRNPVRVVAAPKEDVYCGDAIELFVDADGVFPGTETLPNYEEDTVQLIIAAPETEVDPSARATRFRPPMKLDAWTGNFLMQPVPGGYVFEALITASDIGIASWSLAPGQHLGFDLGINISYDDGTTEEGALCPKRMGQYFLNIDSSQAFGADQLPYRNVQAFCRTQVETP